MPVRLELGAIPDPELVEQVASLLRSGGIALLPTEGVYGLHALAIAEAATARIVASKQRDSRQGFIGLIARPEDLDRWARVEPKARDLARRHWPGPLTLVLDALPAAPRILRGTEGTIALRCPGTTYLRDVVQAAGHLVLSTSANAPGAPAPTRVLDAHSLEGLDLIVDGGALSGVPSTVVRVRQGQIRVLREGAIRLGEGALDHPRSDP